jgi:hypothetical protein
MPHPGLRVSTNPHFDGRLRGGYHNCLTVCTGHSYTHLQYYSTINLSIVNNSGPVYSCHSVPRYHTLSPKWSSYDRTWFSGPDKQEIFI